MNVSIEDKKKEAVERMKLWGIFPETIKQFEQYGLISESAPPVGACYWLNDEQMERVRTFEEKHNAVVYHVIHSYTTIGEMESYLFVSDYPEEWEAYDRPGIERGEQIAWVFNHDIPEQADMGSIGIALTPAAGLRRTW